MASTLRSCSTAAARLRRTGTGALQRPVRAIPGSLRRGQPQSLLPEFGSAVFPRPEAPDARRDEKAAGLDDAEESAPSSTRFIHPPGAGGGKLRTGSRRLGHRRQREGQESAALYWKGLLRLA